MKIIELLSSVPHHCTIETVVLLLMVTVINGQSSDELVYRWDVEIYPNLTSRSQEKFCTGTHRNPPSSICDPDDVLYKHEAQNLDIIIGQISNDTKCLCSNCPPNKRGLNIKVAIAKYILVSLNYSIAKAAQKFGDRTRRRWNYGNKCDNDILIFVEANDEQIHVSMGSNARNVVGDHASAEIVRQTKGHFESGNFYQGLESMIISYQDAAINYKQPTKSTLSTGAIIGIVIGVLALIIVICLLLWFLLYLFRRKRNHLKRSSFEYVPSTKKSHVTDIVRQNPPIYKPVNTKEPIEGETKESTHMMT